MQARALLDGGSYAAAESLAWRLESRADTRRGGDSLEYAQALDLLVEALIRNGHRYQAQLRSFADLALGIRERHLGADRPELVPALLNLGSLLSETGDDAGATGVLARAASLCESVPGPDSLALAEALDELGIQTWNVRHGPEAEASVRRAYAIRDRHLPADHAERAASLGSLSIIAWDQGDGKEAVRLLEGAASMMDSTLGPDHPRLARVLRLLALRKRFMQDPAGADSLSQRAIAIEARSLRPNHPERAMTVFLAAGNLGDLGQQERVGPMIEEALAIQERELPPGHPYIAWNLASLGGWYAGRGDLATARSMLERALAMQRRALSSDDLFIGISERILGAVMFDFGDYREALELYEDSERIYAKHFAEGNPDLLWAHMCIGLARIFTGDPEGARNELLRLLPGAAVIEGPEGRLTSQFLRMIAAADEARGQWGAARHDCARALAILERKRGAGHVEALETRIQLARAEDALGDWSGAQATLLPAIAAADSGHGAPGWDAHARLLLAEVQEGNGEHRAALATALAAERINRDMVQSTLKYLPEEQALRLLAMSPGALGLALDLARGAGVASPSQGEAYEAVIRSRALVLDEAASRGRLLRRNPDPEVAALESSLVVVSTRLANLMVRSTSLGPGEQDAKRLLEAGRERDEIETRLAERLPAAARDAARRSIGLNEVARALPVSTALVSYACYQRSSAFDVQVGLFQAYSRPRPREAPRYLAFVLGPGDSVPVLISLGPAALIDSLIAHYVDEVSRPLPADAAGARARERSCRTLGQSLRRAVWDPVALHLGNTKRAFVVLDGNLQMLNLATLPAPGGGYLVEYGPTLHYLAAERDLVPVADAPSSGRGLLALGDPDFDAAPTAAIAPPAAADQVAQPGGAASGEPQLRRGPSACGGFRGVRFGRLAAAGGEIDTIAAIWRRWGGADPAAGDLSTAGRPRGEEPLASLRGGNAGEAEFKRAAPGHRVLHLATHGFFYSGECAEEWPGLRGVGIVTPREHSPRRPAHGGGSRDPEMSPLLLSGLALAGANRRDEVALDRDDGILTAEEIAAMDLSGVEWAVVSACQSGVGAIRDGEGVFGLRRAFQEAGARTTILSLWSVEDASAREWMRALYEARLLSGMDTPDAARAASLAALQVRRARGASTHPFYWGGFVACGDWR